MMKLHKSYLLCLTCLLLLFSGCSSLIREEAGDVIQQEGQTAVGRKITIEVPPAFTLIDLKDVLAADGLYYAAWSCGTSVPYENSDGETIDLYDAQLYFLTHEALSNDSALDSYNSWLSAAKKNYEIESEEVRSCNGQSYTWITYRCKGEDTPYERGISAFGTIGNTAVCAEFTCLADYSEDLDTQLTEFLEGCHYSTE